MKTKIVSTAGLAVMAGVIMASVASAQDTIALGPSKNELTFQGTGTEVINVVWQNCTTSGCTMQGSGSRGNDPQSAGTYAFSSATATPFKLVTTAVGLFGVTQTSPVSFSYTSQRGTLAGMAHFTSLVQNPGAIGAALAGTLEVTHSTLEAYSSSGQVDVYLTLAVGKNKLASLVDTRASIDGDIDYPSSLAPPSPCRAASVIPSALNSTPTPGGNYVWFNAIFSASGIHNGTVLQFERAFIQFQANGNTYILHVPNAVVTFSSTVACATTRFDSGANTWETNAPVSETNEVFLSGVSFQAPSSGLPGGITLVTWSESFASNTPDVGIDWKWGAARFNAFSADYNLLKIKPTYHNACSANSSDHAGTPEAYANSEAEGSAVNSTGSWSGTAHALNNCP